MAPEQFRGQAFLSTDLYGLGVTLIFLLTNKSPLDLPQRHLKFNFRPLIKTFPKEFADSIDKLVEPNYDERFPNAEAAFTVFENPNLLRNYLDLQPKRPSYTFIRLSSTEKELTITIPPGLFHKRCDHSLFFYLIICYVPTFLFLALSVVTLNSLLIKQDLISFLGLIVYIIGLICYVYNATYEILWSISDRSSFSFFKCSFVPLIFLSLYFQSIALYLFSILLLVLFFT
jgi:eukaryotic-like serine/threonine-protein kinase